LTRTKSIPVHGRLHNIYVTPDGKFLIAGSIPKKLLTVIDLTTNTVAWEYLFDKGVRPMTIEANPDGSTKRIFVQLSDTDGFAVIDFAKREEVARITLPNLHTGVEMDAGRAAAPSHGIGVAPDGKTLWVTSIPQNAVFVYSLANLSLLGQVALPDLKLAGRTLGGAIPNWVTFAPDGNTVYISNAGLRSVSAIDTQSMKLRAVIPVGEVPKRINTLVMR
jgi:YVTN family beta-propeller protein